MERTPEGDTGDSKAFDRPHRANDQVEIWRRTILERSQWLTLLLGVLVTTITVLQQGETGARVMAWTIPGWTLVAVSIAWQRGQTTARAWVFLVGFLWVILAATTQYGFLVPNPFVGGVFLCCIAALILTRRAVWLAILLILTAFASFAAFHLLADPVPTDQAIDTTQVGNWIRVIGNFSILAVGSTGAVLYMLSRLERSLEESGVLLKALDEEAAQKWAAITERLVLEEQLQHAQRLESLGRLAGGIAHDFNNLLSVISGNAELASNPDESPEEKRRALEDISSATERASALTRQLLAFSRKRAIDPGPIDVAESVLSASDLVRRLLPSAVELREEIEEGLPLVVGVPTAVSQIVMNLVINARDAMKDGGQIRIEVASFFLARNAEEGATRFVRIRVSDDGPGMDDDTIRRAFEPFFTTKRDGTGLGLSLVASLAKQCGGWVDLHSRLGEGTCFDVYLSAEVDPGEPAAFVQVN